MNGRANFFSAQELRTDIVFSITLLFFSSDVAQDDPELKCMCQAFDWLTRVLLATYHCVWLESKVTQVPHRSFDRRRDPLEKIEFF